MNQLLLVPIDLKLHHHLFDICIAHNSTMESQDHHSIRVQYKYGLMGSLQELEFILYNLISMSPSYSFRILNFKDLQLVCNLFFSRASVKYSNKSSGLGCLINKKGLLIYLSSIVTMVLRLARLLFHASTHESLSCKMHN